MYASVRVCVFLFMHTSILLCTFIFCEYWFRSSSHSIYICMSVHLLCISFFFLHCMTFVTRYILHECVIAGAASVAVYFYGHSRTTNEPKQRENKKFEKKNIYHKTNSIHRDFRTPYSHSHTQTYYIDTVEYDAMVFLL